MASAQLNTECTHCGTITLQYYALHDCLSSSLENGERKLGHLFCYCRSCKNTLTIPLGKHAYSATGKFKSGLFDIWSCHPANCIPAGHGLYTQFTRPFPSFAEVGRACETRPYYTTPTDARLAVVGWLQDVTTARGRG